MADFSLNDKFEFYNINIVKSLFDIVELIRYDGYNGSKKRFTIHYIKFITS